MHAIDLAGRLQNEDRSKKKGFIFNPPCHGKPIDPRSDGSMKDGQVQEYQKVGLMG
jgi:hypothetical protein